MNMRALFLIAITANACQELPFLSHGTTTSRNDAGLPEGGDSAELGNADLGGGNGAGGTDVFPGFGALDMAASASNALDGIALSGADAGAFSVSVPWQSDGGVIDGALPFTFPSPTSLPPASSTSQGLALAIDPQTEVGHDGCGEPPTCYLRTIIATAAGHLYSTRMSRSYPMDSCVTKTVDCDGAVLIGDSNARFGDALCGAASPQITLGFLVPQGLVFSWQAGQVWESTSGFRSEWTIIDAGGDSGAYEPIPGQLSKLWPAWTRFFAGGEIYGELLVPLRHTVKHTLAIGFALFDIRVRQ